MKLAFCVLQGVRHDARPVDHPHVWVRHPISVSVGSHLAAGGGVHRQVESGAHLPDPRPLRQEPTLPAPG